MQTILGRHWHHLPESEVLTLLESDAYRGLDQFEVDNRLSQFGPNSLTPAKSQSPLKRFVLQFHQALIYILLVAGMVTLVLGEWVDSAVIFTVVVVNAIVSYIQEAKALKAIEALRQQMISDAMVIRAGDKRRLSSTELVPGDLVFLQAGDKVPADLRLLRIRNLQIDESALTGESVPCHKTATTVAPDTVLAERSNIAYSSTLVTYGTAYGLVIATGDDTEIGQISEMIASAAILETPLTRRIRQFSHILVYVILGLATVVMFAGWLHALPLVDVFLAAVALAVAAIPEGLPAAVTIMLAIGVARMAKNRAITRRLPVVETLGSTTVICSDKTGTLTKNQMTVQTILADHQEYSVSGLGYQPSGEISPQGNDNVAFLHTLRAGVLCNEARLHQSGALWKIDGDPTEGALLVSAAKAGIDILAEHQRYPRLDSVPFESAHRYMASVHRNPDNQSLVYLKGSVESVLQRCSHTIDRHGTIKALDPTLVHRQVEEMASRGLRILAFAYRPLETSQQHIDHDDIAAGMVFVGLQGMIDPPRPEAIRAIASCRHAGIQVKMITGDHAHTAAAIARQMGLVTELDSHNEVVISGHQLSKMSDDALISAAERCTVFARVSPDDKLRLVQALQSLDHVVAMTGDGVNDAPALRRADIGIAMALGGTEVAREASDMMLTDDNFATIETAVEEGRGIFDNLRKFIVWTLPTNGGEGGIVLTAVLLGLTLPILPAQILWINMTTAVCLGLMLAFEPKEQGLMQRPPIPPKTSIIDPPLLWRILLVSITLCIGGFGLFHYELSLGASTARAHTVAATVFVVGQAAYLLNCRSLQGSILSVGLGSNLWIWFGLGLMALLQLAFVYLPFMNTLFRSEPIGLESWLRILSFGLLMTLLVGIEKWGWRRHTNISKH